MVKISKKMEYALIILKHMAQNNSSHKHHDGLVCAREISDLYKTPFDTTAKIMQTLNKAKILQSNQGAKGGYSLNKNLNEINYVQLSEIIENKNFNFTCDGPKGLCDLFEGCNIKSPLVTLNTKLKEFFMTISLEDLLLPGEQFIEKDIRGHV